MQNANKELAELFAKHLTKWDVIRLWALSKIPSWMYTLWFQIRYRTEEE